MVGYVHARKKLIFERKKPNLLFLATKAKVVMDAY